ncbi:hypothetical protein BD779DRAFT_1532517 [Infundibulicybe gibba]|nr:hypothetical protein BD779DRAFT_1571844 [Infundibulicybe gibba]KAF8883394.1 hypothetical protein BD779DRAFT_1539687 [Infundibulicybe gibba]KAF8884614.1 hypothetical protein BD779DRAFT_1536106 [Infundibulicybe gibba]KAF8885811.1 hypothetical protein BD779DRAFT_1532517 [Infundibulicybe gibba]
MLGNAWKCLVTFSILARSGHQSQPYNGGVAWQGLTRPWNTQQPWPRMLNLDFRIAINTYMGNMVFTTKHQ